MKKLLIFLFISSLFFSVHSTNINACSMKRLYYFSEDTSREFHTKQYKSKKIYWKKAEILKKNILKSKKKIYKVKYKKKDREKWRMIFATCIARYCGYAENEPEIYCDSDTCEINVVSFKRAYAKSKDISNKINQVIKYLKINKKMTAEAAMYRFNSWIIGQMSYLDITNQCSTWHGFFPGIGVCRTYSYLFRYLCNRVGIKCWTVQTHNHQFNQHIVNGRIGYTDVCWNDTGSNAWVNNILRWFNQSEMVFFSDHDKVKYNDDIQIIKVKI